MNRLAVRVALGIAGAALLVVLGQIAIFAAAPIGGGVYHLIFAYSEGGRLGSAIHVYVVYLLTFASLASALVALDYPTDGRILLGMAAALGTMHWTGIVQWTAPGTELRGVAVALLPVLPAAIILFGLLVLRRQRRALAHAPVGERRPRTFSRAVRGLAWAVLLAPLGFMALGAAVFILAAR